MSSSFKATAHAASVPAVSDGHVVLRDESAGVLRVANAEREFGRDLLVVVHVLRLVRAGARLQSGVARHIVAPGDTVTRLALLVEPRVYLLVGARTRCLNEDAEQSVCIWGALLKSTVSTDRTSMVPSAGPRRSLPLYYGR